jgi:hypothetical protein
MDREREKLGYQDAVLKLFHENAERGLRRVRRYARGRYAPVFSTASPRFTSSSSAPPAVARALGSCKGLQCLIHTEVPGLHMHPGWLRGWR